MVAATKPKKRTKKELTDLAKKIVHGLPDLKLTEAQVVEKLTAIDTKEPGLPNMMLVTKTWADKTAQQIVDAVFGEKKPAQKRLPMKPASGQDLRTQLLNGRIRLRKANALVGAKEMEITAVKADLEKKKNELKDLVDDAFAAQSDVNAVVDDIDRWGIDFSMPKKVAKKDGNGKA